ncbi:MAG TPA: hypothetical protein V6D28_20715 [Leptolyngbyaceae cyanobacterium]
MVEINTPDVDPSAGLVELSANYVDESSRIATTCTASTANRFVVTGNSGLPLSPFEPIRGWYNTTPISLPRMVEDSKRGNTHSPQPPLVEVTRWEINQKGEVILVANAANGSNWSKTAGCGG